MTPATRSAATTARPLATRRLADRLINALLRENFVCCPGVVFPRAVYERLGSYDDRFAFSPDVEMWLRIASHYPVVCCPEVGIRYRLHATQATEEFRNARQARLDLPRQGTAAGAGKPLSEGPDDGVLELEPAHLCKNQHVVDSPADRPVAVVDREARRRAAVRSR